MLKMIKRDIVKYINNLQLDNLYFLISFALLILFCFSIICGNETETGLFFLKGNDFLADFCNVINKSRDLDPFLYGTNIVDPERAYLPFTYIVFYLYSKVLVIDYTWWNLDSISLFWSMLIVQSWMLFLVVSTLYIYEAQIKKKLLMGIIILSSSVSLFSLERGNIIILAAAMVSIFIAFYNSDKIWKRHLAYLSLAIAIALKVYPVVLGLLLVKDKWNKEILYLVVYCFLFVFTPFVFINGQIDNLALLYNNIIISSKIYGNSHLMGHRFGYQVLFLWPQVFSNIYIYIKASYYILAFIIYCGIPFEKTIWKKVLSLLVLLIMIPVNSGEYCGLYLLPGIVLFLNYERKINLRNTILLVCLVLIFQPLQLGYFDRQLGFSYGLLGFHLGWIGLVLFFSFNSLLLIFKYIIQKKSCSMFK